MTPDDAVILAAEMVVDQLLDDVVGNLISDVMTDHPCPHPGLDGASVDRGPRKGLCTYLAEIMIPETWPPYWRCPLHGRIERWTP
jgi:hypothetical protein